MSVVLIRKSVGAVISPATASHESEAESAPAKLPLVPLRVRGGPGSQVLPLRRKVKTTPPEMPLCEAEGSPMNSCSPASARLVPKALELVGRLERLMVADWTHWPELLRV